MTIYCDCKTCLYNEEGFCNAEKINISNFECTTATGFDAVEERPQTIGCFNCEHKNKTMREEPCDTCDKQYSEWEASNET